MDTDPDAPRKVATISIPRSSAIFAHMADYLQSLILVGRTN